ncbi:hypothetical protein K435DRAFT_660915, partial [Dendrothele bispora CBS 962.96]
LMSMFKASCLLLAAVSVFISLTSPNPPAQKKDLVTTKRKLWVSTRGAYVSQVIFYIFTFLVEAFSLLVPHLPMNTFSALLLHLVPPTNNSTTKPRDLPNSFYFGLIFLTISAYIRYRCYQELGRHFTFEVSLLSNHKLITTGPYSIVRHPGYLACYTMTIGILLIWSSEGSWIRESCFLSSGNFVGPFALGAWVIWWGRVLIALTRRVPEEDALLRRNFGKQWIEWERNVPWKIVPGIY